MPISEYQEQLCKLLPAQPPEEVLRFAAKKQVVRKNAIVYRASPGRPKDVKCSCSACGGTFTAQRVNSSGGCVWAQGVFGYRLGSDTVSWRNITICPLCGAEVTAYHCSDISSDADCIDIAEIMQLCVINGHAAAVTWLWRKLLYKDALTKTLITPGEAYVFDARRCYRFSGYYRWYTKTYYMNTFEARAKCSDEIGKFRTDRVAPFSADVFNGTVLENAKIDRYLAESDPDKAYPITYLRSFQQHQQTENLIMQGFSRLFNDIVYANIFGSGYYRTGTIIPRNGINWKGRRPAELLEISTEQFRAARSQKWNLDELELVRTANEGGIAFDIEKFRRRKIEYFIAKQLLKTGVDPFRALTYVQKQGKKLKNGASLTLLTDYYELCKKLKISVTPRIAFPADLKREHDRLTDLYNAKTIEKKAEGAERYNKQFETLAKQYAALAYEHEGLCIRIASAPRDLFEEGVTLGHCVGTYVGSHAKGDRCIFLLRQTSAPDKPYFTLELDMRDLHVIQNRGSHNCARTPEVQAFENEWISHIHNLIIQKGA